MRNVHTRLPRMCVCCTRTRAHARVCARVCESAGVRVLCLIVCLLPNRMFHSSPSYPLCLSRLYPPSLSLSPLFVPTQCQTLRPEYVCENGNEAHEANGQQFVEIDNLQVLDLRSNLITDEGDRAVSAMLLQRTRILRVDLCYNRIGPQGDNWCF